MTFPKVREERCTAREGDCACPPHLDTKMAVQRLALRNDKDIDEIVSQLVRREGELNEKFS